MTISSKFSETSCVHPWPDGVDGGQYAMQKLPDLPYIVVVRLREDGFEGQELGEYAQWMANRIAADLEDPIFHYFLNCEGMNQYESAIAKLKSKMRTIKQVWRMSAQERGEEGITRDIGVWLLPQKTVAPGSHEVIKFECL